MTYLKNPNWWEEISWLFTKRGLGFENGANA